MTHFDETSGVVPSATPWGCWYQTMQEVTIEVHLPEGTTGKLVKCDITPKRMTVKVKGDTIIEGEFSNTIHAEDSVWTIEDKKLLRIVLPKVLSTADQCWRSLLKGQYEPDAWTYDQMEQKLTLQRYQFEVEQGWGDAT